MKNDERLYKIIIKMIQEGNLLDVGCGDGNFAKIINKNVEYYGIDIKKNSNGVKECDITKDRFPFKNNFFDTVIMLEVLEHIPDYTNCFLEIKRVLKKDGVFICSVPNCYKFYKIKRDFFNQNHETPEHIVSFHKNTIKNLLEKEEFTKIKVFDKIGILHGTYVIAKAKN